MARATAWTSAPICSQRFAISLMYEILVARKALAAYFDSSAVGTFVITRPDVKRAADPREIAAVVGKQAETVEVVEDPARALDRARALAGSERFVVVTGSLYLIGEILGLLEQQPVRGPVSM